MTTTLEDVQFQMEQYWSPLFMGELREKTLLLGLVNKAYDGEIKNMGDRVTVSQFNAPDGELLTISQDANLHQAARFRPEPVSTSKVVVTADKRAVASYDIEDLVELQSQIQIADSKMMNALRFSVERKMNNYLYTLVAPSTSSPDHTTASVTNLAAATIAAQRVLAGEALWNTEDNWYSLLSPAYWGDLIQDSKLANADYGSDTVMIQGKGARLRMGFNCVEDNSRSGKYGLFFHPDFLYLVMQQAPRIKISDLHPTGKFGYAVSVDVVFGAVLGIDGALKHTTVVG